MKEYFNLLPLSIHIVLILYVIISHNNDKILKQRISPSVESPIAWQIKPASNYHLLMSFYEDISILILIVIAILFGIYFKWYYSLFFIAEALIISGIITGLVKTLLLRIGQNMFFAFQMFIFTIRPITILLDIFLFYNIWKIITSS